MTKFFKMNLKELIRSKVSNIIISESEGKLKYSHDASAIEFQTNAITKKVIINILRTDCEASLRLSPKYCYLLPFRANTI